MVKPEDTARFVGHISSEAKRLVTLIGDIIELSELDEGVEPPKGDVNVAKVAESVIAELTPAAEGRNVTISSELSDVVVRCSESLLREVIFNLTDNAIKYNRDGGSLKVTVAPDKNGCRIVVSDTGIGIPAEALPHVFERFYRVDKSHSKASGGTGLGLSIVKHAVMCMGGSVSINSEINKGTSVTVNIQ